MSLRSSRFASLLVVLAAGRAMAAGSAAVAFLPMENLSAASEAPAALAPSLGAALERRGWRLAGRDAVERALDAAHVRYLDSLESGVGARLAEEVGASVLAMGTVFAFDAGDDPRVAFDFSLVSADGRVLFSDLVAMRAEDALGAFQFGKPVSLDELAAAAVRRLARGIPAPGAPPSGMRARSLPVHLGAPRTFRAAALGSARRNRVVVLPFADAGPHEAARVVEELFVRRLPSSKIFDAVPPADLRAAFVAEKIHDLSDPAERMRLGRRLGTTLYLSGTIYEYREAHQASSDSPRLEMEARLTDAETGRIVWTSYAARKGSDYRGLLKLGAITSVVGLTDQAVSEMIRAAEKAHPAPPPGASRRASQAVGSDESANGKGSRP